MKKNWEYYNEKISPRANACIKKRRAVVRIQKCILAILFILSISFFAFFYNDIRILANWNKDFNAYNQNISIVENEILLDTK